MSKKPVIAFAGMTHLGLNSAAAAAERGFDIICFDPNGERIAELSALKTSINEPQLMELLTKNQARMAFTSNTADLAKADITYISIDVPTDDKGASDLAPVRALIDVVNPALRADALMVVLCQVPPGFTRSLPRDKVHLYYQVETLIFGRAIERAMYPERYIIGCANPAQPLHPWFEQYLKAYACPLLPMRYESAELAKTAINLFLAASVCTSNTLAELCEKIGADWQEIIPSLQLDRRIGQYAYLQPGLGLSGGNIERDLETLSQLGYANGAKATVPAAYIEHSRYRKQWPVRAFYEHYDPAQKDFTVAVLGLAYKENTHSVKNSPAVDLIEALPDIRIQAYDPVVKSFPTTKNVQYCASAYEAAKGADMVLLMTAWDEFKSLDWAKLQSAMRGKLIVDPFRLMAAEAVGDATRLVLGRAS